jgi:hypothetical protein
VCRRAHERDKHQFALKFKYSIAGKKGGQRWRACPAKTRFWKIAMNGIERVD